MKLKYSVSKTKGILTYFLDIKGDQMMETGSESTMLSPVEQNCNIPRWDGQRGEQCDQ